MAELTEIRVPDIGDFADVPVIEILVRVGDRVQPEDPLITLESDKATMDVPAPSEGVVREIAVSVGDSVSEGSVLMRVEAGEIGSVSGAESVGDATSAGPGDSADGNGSVAGVGIGVASSASAQTMDVRVPDIGDFSDVPVIEVLVEAGDRVRPEDPLVTLESDKATMDVPSPVAGTIVEVALAVGDIVSEGALILTVEAAGAVSAATTGPASPAHDAPASPSPTTPEPATAGGPSDAAPARARPEDTLGTRASRPLDHPASASARGDATAIPDPRAPRGRPSPTAALASEPAPRPISHATPAMRRYARELGVDLARVKGTGRKGRILREDISGFVKTALAAPPRAAAEGTGIPPIPAVDFAKFGEIETRPLSRIKRISGPHLHRAWVNVPHVTSHDEADVTDLEAFRQSIKAEAATRDVRITLLAFVTRAVASALATYPLFNASLGPGGDTLVIKKYIHIGIAVDTPNGLMVPVLRDADRKGVYDLAREMADLGSRAREGALKPDEMRGGTFSISSLGGIGGTAFTPIINAPEVAILGLSRTRMTPVWNGTEFAPRLMLPLDLSWDHRVVDGAEAARFLAHLARSLGDVRRLLL